ncbi:MAG: hypothetical protein MUF54_09500, partial [Polyangiaceae bacterium]|nr:hypothetical protein [Polyangiaceae bacterium]
ELDEFQTDPVPLETRAFVREMVLGALQRSRASVADVEQKSAGWAKSARRGVRDAVLGGIEELRWQIVEGQVAELRSRLLSRATTPLRLIEDARRLPSVLRKACGELTQAVQLAVGGDRIERARQYLGLPAVSDAGPLEPSVFAPPSGKLNHLPLVYRRLFSAQALEAGDLLVGRAPAIARARRALAGDSGKRLRSVALIGPDGVGKGAVANAILRGFDAQRVETLSLSAPVSVGEVDSWFSTPREGRFVAVTGFYWLFAACPGGLEPLRRFVAGVVADQGRNAWMVRGDALTWAFAARLAPTRDAFAEVVELEPFDVEQLKAAVLARHGMSGYRLAFGRREEEQGALQRIVASSLRNVRTHQSWFRALHRASGGLIRDALVLWMASVEAVDDAAGVVRIGKVQLPPTNALRHLPEEVLLTLWQASRNGWTDPRVHAELFRMALSTSEAHLHRMEHIGLLRSKDGRYRVAVHLRGALHRVLGERGWLV